MTFPKIENAMLNIGSSTGQLVQFNNANKLPALDGSQLTNVPANLATNGMVLLATQTVTSPIAQVDFVSGIDSNYKEYMLRGSDISLSSSDSLSMRLRLRGTFQTVNGYTYGGYAFGNAIGGSAFTNAGNDSFVVIPGADPLNGANANGGFILNITNPAGTSRIKALHLTGGGVGGNGSNHGFGFHNGGAWNNGGTDYAPIDGIRFITPGGTNIASGTFKLYGIQ